MRVVLTVADHEQNGFVALASWRFDSEAGARAFIKAHDDAVDPEAEPDIKTAPFTFILDLMDANGDMPDTGERLLPTQNAMKLAPEQVQKWLEERPEPDSVIDRAVPRLKIAA